jgi:hypothetical protein
LRVGSAIVAVAAAAAAAIGRAVHHDQPLVVVATVDAVVNAFLRPTPYGQFCVDARHREMVATTVFSTSTCGGSHSPCS